MERGHKNEEATRERCSKMEQFSELVDDNRQGCDIYEKRFQIYFTPTNQEFVFPVKGADLEENDRPNPGIKQNNPGLE